MGYRRALLFRWSSRDVLAVLALAVIVAFLTGSVVFYTAAADKPTAIAQEFEPLGEVREFATVEQANTAAGERALVLPFTELDGTDRLVVGVDDSARQRGSTLGIDLPIAPDRGVGSELVTDRREVTIRTADTQARMQVTPLADTGALPQRWYVTRPEALDRVGRSGAFVILPPSEVGSTDEATTGESQSVIRGTLLFFERGTEQVLNGFVVLVVAAGVLGAVTIGSIIRMTVRDRRETIQVVRATGATAWSIVGLFATRGLLLTSAAIAIGYAIGLVVSSLVTSVAVFTGVPTTLSARVSPETVRLLAGIYTPVLAVGTAAGAVAALPLVWQPPRGRTSTRGASTRSESAWQQLSEIVPALALFETRVLDWRAVVPTAATVSVFVALVLLISAGGVVAEPLASETSTTIVEPEAPHPVASRIPASYADGFAAQNVSASPEILLFAVVDDEPTIVRGARYDSFAAVTNASLVAGRQPENTSEALIGTDLARTHEISVGDTVLVGSGTGQSIGRVEVVGTYRAPGAYDDQLLVSLESARHLTTLTRGQVNFVRLSGATRTSQTDRDVRVAALSLPAVPTPDRVTVNVTVVNTGEINRTRDVTVMLGGERVTETVTVTPQSPETISVRFAPGSPGNYTVSAGGLSREVIVRDPERLVIRGLPAAAPTDSIPQIRVVRGSGEPARNLTVTVGNRTRLTDENGYARIPVGTAGTKTVRASDGERITRERLTVTSSTRREIRATVTVSPRPVEQFARPTAQVELYNPWNRTATGTVRIQGPDSSTQRDYTLEPGETANVETALPRLSAGEYTVTAYLNGTVVAETTYEVGGSDRLSTVLARNTEMTAGGGLGAAISVAFGNLSVIAGALAALAGAMTCGALVASFARAIHARRQTLGIHRATGAPPQRLLWIVFVDTLRIGGVSVIAGVLLGTGFVTGLAALDLLVFYGIRITPAWSLETLLLVSVVAFGLVLIGALVPTIAVLRQSPASSFRTVTHPQTESSHE